MDASPTRLISHVQNGVSIVHFTEAEVIDQWNINLIGSELTKMVESGGVLKMLINMGNCHYSPSAVFC